MPYHVYILASRRNGTLYFGVTNDLVRRVWQHRQGGAGIFSGRYGVRMLVHAEPFDDVRLAIRREKTLKAWPRAWKLALIERDNPQWRDLYDDVNR
ncbi:MAG TPA: GIY-YIG nuclease family protein [Alphaproteobacteria bacterium]|nr:GIY-YIG nuclease family protein [Alphaproteobacteria bacterium]